MKNRLARLPSVLLLACGALHTSGASAAAFPQYDHVFLLIEENENYSDVIGSPYAPILNALASDYGVATNYTGVGDPSEPNYVGMLGGDTFGIASDDPYWFPGQTVDAANLISQLDDAGKTWKGYFQGMPYPGYRGYCYPDKCNGIPDADTQYVVKHNGIANFANLQNPVQFGKMHPIKQLAADLASGAVPNLSYIVPDECDDSHGAPPWCVDSNDFGTVQQNWLIAKMDAFVGDIVKRITSSSTWHQGNNAIVITFDEGDEASSQVLTVVITNHGPRGVADPTSYNHYSLLASLQQTFGVGCLLNSCTATPMTPLFSISGSVSVPKLPEPYRFPTMVDEIYAQGPGTPAAAFSPSGNGWELVPTFSFGAGDNVLAAVSAASTNDAWAVGTYYPTSTSPLATLGHHWDGSRWTAYPLPNVGVQENTLLSVSMPGRGEAWAVGYYVSGRFKQRTLVEHYIGGQWSVVPSPNPGAKQNILYGVAAIAGSDVWAVGAQEDADGLWHTLAEHWDGDEWAVVPTVDEGSNGNQLYAVKARATNDVYAVGQQAGTSFPGLALVEHWDGSEWSGVSSPGDPAATLLPLAVTAKRSSLVMVGQRETDVVPYTTYVAAGAPGKQQIKVTPNQGTGENDLFGVATTPDGTLWTVGWDINTTTGNHEALVLKGTGRSWSLVSTPNDFAGAGDYGLSGIATIPGGGMWAVGIYTDSNGNYAPLIEYRHHSSSTAEDRAVAGPGAD